MSKPYTDWRDPRLLRRTIEMIEGCLTRCQPEYIPHWEAQIKRYYRMMTDEQIRRLKEARNAGMA